MDLHPLLGVGTSTIEFRVVRRGRLVRVDVPVETVSQRFGVPDDAHGLLVAYEANRTCIDNAVLRRADESCGAGVILVRPMDL